jgi:transposase
MAKSLSEDLRARLIAAVDGGMSRRAAAERFGVSASSAVRWVKLWRKSGAAQAKRQGGDRRSQRVEVFAGIILEAVAKKVDITLVELSAMLRQKHGQHFAPSTLWRFLDRHSMTLKKNGARRRADQARRRRAAPSLGASAA